MRYARTLTKAKCGTAPSVISIPWLAFEIGGL